jgi:hypothetical protein
MKLEIAFKSIPLSLYIGIQINLLRKYTFVFSFTREYAFVLSPENKNCRKYKFAFDEFRIEQGTRERESLEDRIKEDQTSKNQDEDSFTIRFDCQLVLDDEYFISRVDEEPENFEWSSTRTVTSRECKRKLFSIIT